jgi:WD40 repeat protein/serine/threonine protein kinase
MTLRAVAPEASDCSADDALLAQWVADVTARLERGESIDFEAYERQDAPRADRLRKLLPTLVRLAHLSAAESASNGPGQRLASATGLPTSELGDFRLIREIGRGGMGVVFEAVQLSLGRRVALKLLPVAATMDKCQVQRFQLEAQAAGLLQHKGIVPVYSVGWEHAVPYYVMQYIDGRSLAELIRVLRLGMPSGAAEPVPRQDESTYAEAQPTTDLVEAGFAALGDSTEAGLDPSTVWGAPAPFADTAIRSRPHIRTAAGLALQAAEALAHAHEQGVVHRDIKPANLLVDVRGDLWVTDFGLARVQAHPGMTAVGTLLGTLRYMSPEQAGAIHAVVDHRTDVYSLGATLYELLTLRPPIAGRDSRETLRQIAEKEPVRVRTLNPAVPDDLQTIVMKAMAKEVEARYASAGALAEDLRRFLAGQPIYARPVSRREWVVKWARRRPAEATLLGLLAGVVIALLAIVIRSNVFLRSSNAQLRAASALAERQEFVARRRAYAYQIKRVSEAGAAGDTSLAQWLLQGLRHERKGFEWHYLERAHNRDVSFLFGHHTEVWALALSPDQNTLVSSDLDGFLCFWDLQRWRLRSRVQGHKDFAELILSPDGRTLVSYAGIREVESDEVKVWDVATGQERAVLAGITGRIGGSLSFRPDSRRLALVEWTKREAPDGAARAIIWDMGDLAARKQPLEVRPDCAAIAYSPDGRWLAVADRAGTIVLHDAATGRFCADIPGSCPQLHSIAFSADGNTLAGLYPNGVLLWETATGRALDFNRNAHLEQFRFPPNGRRFALVDRPANGELVIGDLATTEPALYREPLPGDHQRIAFSSDAKRLAAWGEGLPPTVWEVDAPQRVTRFQSSISTPNRAVFDARCNSLFFICKIDDRIRAWHLEPGPDPVQNLRGHDAEVWSLAFLPDGRTLASAGDDHDIKLWDIRQRALKDTLRGHGSLVTAIAISPDGQTLASGSFDKTIRLWDLPEGRARGVLQGHTAEVRAVAFSPDGRQLASGGTDLSVRLWDLGAGGRAVVIGRHTNLVRALAFAPGGEVLVSSGEDAVLRVWDVKSRRRLQTLECPKPAVTLAFSPDGSSLVSGDEHGNLLVWDTAMWSQRAWLRGSSAAVRCIRFSPDGLTLAAACDDAKIRLWEATTAQELLALEGHQARVNAVAFSPDGMTLASGSHDGAVKLWRAGPP